MSFTREEKINIIKDFFSRRPEPGKMPAGDLEALKGEFVEFTDEDELVIKYAIEDWQRNGIGNLQGGMICCLMDCSFGVLAYTSTGCKPVASIDMTTNYLRAFGPEEKTLITRTRIRTQGTRIMHVISEAYNEAGKLIASATSNMINIGG